MLKFALIGSDIQNSLSPQIFDWLGRRSKTEVLYKLVNVGQADSVVDAIKQLREEGFKGLNVTRPFKSEVGRLYPSEDFNSIGAVNWVDLEQGVSANTDFLAIHDLLKPHHPKSALIYGSGGAAKAAVVALKKLDCKTITIENRSSVAEFCQEFTLSKYNGEKYDWLIQATPRTELSSDWEHLLAQAQIGVFDMVYRPHRTDLLLSAQARKLIAIPGLAMLVRQAIYGWTKWTGIEVPAEWARDLSMEMESLC